MKQFSKQDDYLEKIIHNLKTPTSAQIQALQSFLQTSQDKISQEENDLIKLTLNSCNKMHSLIETISSIEKLNYEIIKPNYEKFNLTSLLDNILKESEILLKYYELKIKNSINENIVINADKLKIKKVLESLVSNSIEVAQKNSQITIEAQIKKDELFFEIKIISNSNELTKLKEIIENHNILKTKERLALHLGLYLSKEIIHAHFGRMILNIFPDQRNTLGFIIPWK